MEEHGTCGKVERFSTGEKIVVQGTFYLAILAGAWGMWPAGPWLALGYLAFVLAAYILLMRYTVCARCPHLFRAGDCLFIPASLARTFVAPRQGRLTAWEFLIVTAAPLGTVVIPLYWLAARPALLAAFLLLTLACVGFLTRRICRRKCRVRVCPLNRNPDLG